MYLSERSSTKTQFWQLTQTKGKSNRVLDLVCFTCRMDWRLTRRATPGSQMWVYTRSWSLARERRNHPSFLELSSFPEMTRHTFANPLQWLWRQQDWCSWLTGRYRTLITAQLIVTRHCPGTATAAWPCSPPRASTCTTSAATGTWSTAWCSTNPRSVERNTYQLSKTAHHLMYSSSSKFFIG